MYIPDLSNLKLPDVPPALSDKEINEYTDRIAEKLKKKDAVVIAHYYTNDEVQQLAEKTGGFIGDSLEMAKWGRSNKAKTVIVAGVRFMGETAKILSPEKRYHPKEFSVFSPDNKRMYRVLSYPVRKSWSERSWLYCSR